MGTRHAGRGGLSGESQIGVVKALFDTNILIDYLRGFSNLQEIGRYGTYKYNNQDHSILMGYLAARNLAGERHDLWDVNTDTVYYEDGEALRRPDTDLDGPTP